MNHLIDIILFPLYVALFALFFNWRRKKIADPVLKKYHRIGFWIKIFSAFAYIIYSLNLAKLDSVFLYYPEGLNIAKLILKDFSMLRCGHFALLATGVDNLSVLNLKVDTTVTDLILTVARMYALQTVASILLGTMPLF